MAAPNRAFVETPPKRQGDSAVLGSWWTVPAVQTDRKAFDQLQAERAKLSWGKFGTKYTVSKGAE